MKHVYLLREFWLKRPLNCIDWLATFPQVVLLYVENLLCLYRLGNCILARVRKSVDDLQYHKSRDVADCTRVPLKEG